jgi:hypothetical protein
MQRPSYETHVEPKLNLIQYWTRNGLVVKDIANNLSIGYSTLKRYLSIHKDLRDALNTSKEEADAMVVSALFKRAIGYEYEEVKTIIEQTGSGKNLKENKRVEKTKKVLPPNITAQIFWLKNRLKAVWKDAPKDDESKNETADAVAKVVQSLLDLVQNPQPNRTLEDIESDDDD